MLLSRVDAPFYTLPVVHKAPCSHAQQHLLFVVFRMTAILTGVR